MHSTRVAGIRVAERISKYFKRWFPTQHFRQLKASVENVVSGHGSGNLWTFVEVNPLQTIAAYIDLNPVRAGIVEDPKDYRFCGYAEVVAGKGKAKLGLAFIWADSMKLKKMKDGSHSFKEVLAAHRMLIFGKGSHPWTHKGKLIDHDTAVKVLEKQQGQAAKDSHVALSSALFYRRSDLGLGRICPWFYRRLAKRKRTKVPSSQFDARRQLG